MGRIMAGLVSGVWVLMLLVAVFGVVLNVPAVRADGTVYIRADGSVEGTTYIVSSDNVTYVFAANINDSIVVERDNIVVDGASYTLQGTVSGNGIDLSGRTNTTVQNTQIKNFEHAILLSPSSKNNSISGNNITNNQHGIYFYHSSNNSVSGNNIASNSDGILLDYYSSNNSVSGNNITNNVYGIRLDFSSNYNSVSGNNITNNYDGILLIYSFNNTVFGNNFVNDGLVVLYSYGNVVLDNLVNGKPLVYLEDASDMVVEDAGQVVLINCNCIRVENLNLSHASTGVELWNTNGTILTANNITNNDSGIYFYYSSNNNVSGNNITNNHDGIDLDSGSNYNSISGNNITNNDGYGIRLDSSSNNIICHNNFIDNYRQVKIIESGYPNIWDDGYPSGGNYWSDYNGTDLYGGSYQNETGSDGIGDTEYAIDGNNTDHYPLMGMFSEFDWISLAAPEQRIQTICNSTISDLVYNGTAICFDVTGDNGTSGFCRIRIPKVFMNSTFAVFVNGTEIAYTLLPFSTSNYSYLYFNYTHSTQEVIIIPEFPLFLILLMFMMTTLLSVIVYRRKYCQTD